MGRFDPLRNSLFMLYTMLCTTTRKAYSRGNRVNNCSDAYRTYLPIVTGVTIHFAVIFCRSTHHRFLQS